MKGKKSFLEANCLCNPNKTLSVALKDGGWYFLIAIEKLNKNNFQMLKFRFMSFMMGKVYWEFITSDEKEPPFLKNPTQQQIQDQQNLASKC